MVWGNRNGHQSTWPAGRDEIDAFEERLNRRKRERGEVLPSKKHRKWRPKHHQRQHLLPQGHSNATTSLLPSPCWRIYSRSALPHALTWPSSPIIPASAPTAPAPPRAFSSAAMRASAPGIPPASAAAAGPAGPKRLLASAASLRNSSYVTEPAPVSPLPGAAAAVGVPALVSENREGGGGGRIREQDRRSSESASPLNTGLHYKAC